MTTTIQVRSYSQDGGFLEYEVLQPWPEGTKFSACYGVFKIDGIHQTGYEFGAYCNQCWFKGNSLDDISDAARRAFQDYLQRKDDRRRCCVCGKETNWHHDDIDDDWWCQECLDEWYQDEWYQATGVRDYGW